MQTCESHTANSSPEKLIKDCDQTIREQSLGGESPAKSDDQSNDVGNADNQAQKDGKSETRGRKMTVVNFLPSDCKLCGENFSSDKALGYHIRDVHVVGKKDKKESEEGRKKKPKDYHYIRGKDWKVLNPKRPYCCSTCGKRFLYESSMNHHKVVKHNEKIITPDGNEASISIPPKMYNHTFQCDQCGKILMSKHSLIRHLVSFHGTDHEKPFQCDICGQRYVSISSLVSHRRKEHTGDKPYVCEHCNKAFTMSNRLKCHLRVHSDEKFYKCTQCSKQFKSCSAFRAHKDTHAGVMRHTCKYCGRKFLFQGNMIKHIRRRHPNGEKTAAAAVESTDGSNDNRTTATNSSLKRPCSTIKSTGQGPDHPFLTKDISSTIASQNHLEDLDQQQQHNMNLSPMEQFVQPEIQFQVLPLASLPNQELFNGVTYQQAHVNSSSASSITIQSTAGSSRNSNTVTIIRSEGSSSGGCRLCDQTFPDIRFHINDFHRIPLQKVESFIPTMVYF